MAFDDKDKKTRLHNMLSGQQAKAPAVGKRTAVANPTTNTDHGEHTANTAANADHEDAAEETAGPHHDESVDTAGEHAKGAEATAGPAPAGDKPVATEGSAASAAPIEGGFGESAQKEGGGGEPKPGAASGPAKAPPKGNAGKVTVKSEKGAKGASESIPQIGVGEKVTFSAQEEGTWRVGQTELGQGQSIDWTAPDTGTIRNVVFEPYLTSANKNTQASIPILVLAPSKVDFKKVGDVPATGPGLAGVGMTMQVSVGPNSVSFGNAEWLEKPGPAEGVSGYFAAYVASGQSLAHPPNPNWLPMGDDNKAIMDNAWTRDKPKLKHPTDGTMRWWAGSFQWSIPNVYRVTGGGGEHMFANVVQRFTMDDTGAITVTKGGASATARPDNQMDGEIQKFKDIKEATTFLQPHGRAGCVQAVMNYQRNPKADPASVQQLIAALRSFDVTFYVAVSCSNTFSWTDPDKVTVTANGVASKGGQRKINTGKTGEFEFQVNSILNLNKLGTNPISLAANVEDITSSHPHSASLGYPYSAKGAAMDGSSRYTYSAFFK